jgi:hypothetical protein
MGGYFHQDYAINGNTTEEIVKAYQEHSHPEDWMGVRADIHRFLRRYDDSRTRQEFIRIFGSDIDPELWEPTTRQWLLKIDELLQQIAPRP